MIMSIWSTILICAGGVAIYVLYLKLTDVIYDKKIGKMSSKTSNEDNSKITSRRVCYHTTTDCENCINFTHCSQHYGEGLVRSAKYR